MIMMTRYDTLIFHNKAWTAASPFKTPFRAKGPRYYCIWPSVTNARIGYIYNVRLRYSETIYNPSFWASRQGPGPPQQQQQQQHPEPGSQFLKANISRQLNRSFHSKYAYFAHETNQLATLSPHKVPAEPRWSNRWSSKERPVVQVVRRCWSIS